MTGRVANGGGKIGGTGLGYALGDGALSSIIGDETGGVVIGTSANEGGRVSSLSVPRSVCTADVQEAQGVLLFDLGLVPHTASSSING